MFCFFLLFSVSLTEAEYNQTLSDLKTQIKELKGQLAELVQTLLDIQDLSAYSQEYWDEDVDPGFSYPYYGYGGLIPTLYRRSNHPDRATTIPHPSFRPNYIYENSESDDDISVAVDIGLSSVSKPPIGKEEYDYNKNKYTILKNKQAKRPNLQSSTARAITARPSSSTSSYTRR